MELYVKAASKKQINEKLMAGLTVYGTNFSMFGGGGTYELNKELPTGTVIKIYEKTISGNPYAKSYGTWDAAKNKVK